MNLFGKKTQLFSPVTGEIKSLDRVNDEVFSARLLGDGFAVEPVQGHIYSPVKGKVSSVFPSKHAISIKTKSNFEVLIHIGLDTVELDGKGFDMKVKQGDSIDSSTELVTVDFDYVRKKGKETDVIVVFPEAKLSELNLSYGHKMGKEEIGFVK